MCKGETSHLRYDWPMDRLGRALLATVARQTSKDLDHIERALVHLSDDDVWVRANPASNSIGNLLLHLAGSHRFWVVSTVGRQSNSRNRQAEFDTQSGLTTAELVTRLARTVSDANDVLAQLDPDTLLDAREAFGRSWTVLEAIQHTTTHFSHHTGQILHMVKAMKGVDLALYQP